MVIKRKIELHSVIDKISDSIKELSFLKEKTNILLESHLQT